MKRILAYAAYALLIVAVVGGVLLVAALLPPISWLPKPSEARAVLGPLLSAHGAITALTLAVALFVLQGVRSRTDADDRIYQEYLRQSWIEPIFLFGLIAVVAGGAAYSVLGLNDSLAQGDNLPGLRNLALASVLAFGINIVLVWLLFNKAKVLSQPNRWQELRRRVNERDVGKHVEGYIQRRKEAMAQGRPMYEMLSELFEGAYPIPAITLLYRDARRAVGESDSDGFQDVIDSFCRLTLLAEDRIRSSGLAFDSQEWPPLAQINIHLRRVQWDIANRRDDLCLYVLNHFRAWLVEEGCTRRNWPMFSAGLDGFRETLVRARGYHPPDALAVTADSMVNLMYTCILQQKDAYWTRYIAKFIEIQALTLATALRTDSWLEFQILSTPISSIRDISDSQAEAIPVEELPSLDAIEQNLRIRLMGLGGLALGLAENGNVSNPGRYLGLLRIHSDLQIMADDLAGAITHIHRQGVLGRVPRDINHLERLELQTLDQHSVVFFIFRLIELAREPAPALNFHGYARTVLAWFEDNIDSVDYMEKHYDAPDREFQAQRELARQALRDAVRAEVAGGC